MVSKSITLRVPVDIIYRALKDTRLEKLFPEFFVGVTRKPINDKENEILLFIQLLKIVKFKSSKNLD